MSDAPDSLWYKSEIPELDVWSICKDDLQDEGAVEYVQKSKLDAAQKELEISQIVRADLATENKDLSNQIADLSAELDRKNDEIEEMQDSFDNHEDEACSLESELLKTRRERDAALAELKDFVFKAYSEGYEHGQDSAKPGGPIIFDGDIPRDYAKSNIRAALNQKATTDE